MASYNVATGIVGKAPRSEGLERLAAAGFTGVELMADPGHLDDWVSDPAAARRDLEALGMRAESVHLPSAGWNISDPDDSARRAAVDADLAGLRQAAEVGADIVIAHPNGRGEAFTVEGRDASLARSRASLEEFTEAARALGLRVALENLPHRHTPRPGSAMADVLMLIEGLGDHVGICLDAGHSNANGYSAADDARLAGERLWALHIQDNDGAGEDQHLLPGQGTTDWVALLAALDELGFRGLRTFEVSGGEDPEATLAALRRIRDAWNAR